jgi:hypothetical protein
VKEKPAEIAIVFVEPDGTIKNIAIYILCGLMNWAGTPPNP